MRCQPVTPTIEYRSTARRWTSTIAFSLCVASFAAAGDAQPLSFSADNYPAAVGARAIASGDFDRNGWPDVAQANTGANSVTVLLNHRGTLTRSADIPVGAGPFAITTGDFNRDGVPDLAVACADGNSVALLIGSGNGTFRQTAALAAASVANPRAVLSADVNADGLLDLIVTGYESNAVQLWIGNGAGGFAKGTAWSGFAAHPQGIGVADFNHDGRIDIVVAYDGPAGLAVLYGTTSGFATPAAVSASQNLNVISTADLNNDGWMDVAAASTANGRVAVYLGGARGLTFRASYATGPSPRGIAIGDVNHDGALDVTTANYGASTVSILAGTRTNPYTLRAAVDVAANQGSRALALADFNQDGRLDIATANQQVGLATVLLNQTPFTGAGFSFSKSFIGPYGDTQSSGNRVVPADFNRDGKTDLATLSAAYNSVDVIITGGARVTLHDVTFLDGWIVDDFNNDGNPDVLLAQGYPSTAVSVFLGNGQGGFGTPVRTTSALQLQTVRATRMNGDAFPDLIAAALDPASGNSVILVMPGAGNGTFTVGRSRPIGSLVYVLGDGDFNRDGRQDAAVLLYPRGLQVWFGDGAGGFASSQSSDVFLSNIESSIVTGDLNHDGYPDLVASSDGTLAILLGSGAGFGPPTYLPLVSEGSGSGALALADLNMDGDLDIATDQGVIFFGSGDGSVVPARFDYQGYGVVVTDFNRDGLPDVLFGYTNGQLGVLLNQRNDVNHKPVVSPSHFTFNYQDQFGDDRLGFRATASDPDAHYLTYEWRDSNGKLISDINWVSLDTTLKDGDYQYTVTASDGRGASATAMVTVTIAPTKEVVVYAADGWVAGTAWSLVAEATAAGGVRAYNPNRNAAKVTAPAASPTSAVTLSFIADPSQAYKLWVRLKAEGNSFNNDSVWVQFSGASDAAGKPAYRLGTTSGLAVNLEECSGCGVSGWGWEDDGWGAVNANGITLKFPEGGVQRLQLQTREDGVSIDQVVLSSGKYAAKRPGLAKNDVTILPRTYSPPQ
jgi:hypothetical protein